MMHKNIYNFILSGIPVITVALALFAIPAVSTAQTAPLSVDFETEPLFDASNFLPGDTTTKTVEVTNNSENTQTARVEAVNVIDNEGLGEKLDINITEGQTIRYEDTLHDFLRDGEITLSNIPAGGSTTYTFSVIFENTDDNSTQGASLGFDLCVGFAGGNISCGDTATSPENNGTTESTGGSGGGSSPGGQFIQLEVYNERVTETNELDGDAEIQWNTNRLATSRVIYGPADQNYTLDINTPPGYGYPQYTQEFTPKTKDHTVTLSGLTPGETYKYRVVSRASPPTISSEHRFTLALDGRGGANATGSGEDDRNTSGEVLGEQQSATSGNENNQQRSGIVAGASTSENSDIESTRNKNGASSSTSLLAGIGSIGSNLDDQCIDIALIFAIGALVLAYLIHTFISRRWSIRWLFVGSLLLGALVALIASLFCTLIPLLIITVLIMIVNIIIPENK